MKPAILIVRPQPGAAHTASIARESSMTPHVYPLFEARSLPWKPPNPTHYDALLASSANAFRLGGPALAALDSLPVYAVGPATAGAARVLGLTVALQGNGSLEDLLRGLAANAPKRLLRLAGRNHVEVALAGTVIDTRIVYAVDPVALPAVAATHLRDDGIWVTLHSPRAARHFAAECERLGLQRETVRIAALSEAVATAAGAGWADRIVAPRPDDALLLSTVRLHCRD